MSRNRSVLYFVAIVAVLRKPRGPDQKFPKEYLKFTVLALGNKKKILGFFGHRSGYILLHVSATVHPLKRLHL